MAGVVWSVIAGPAVHEDRVGYYKESQLTRSWLMQARAAFWGVGTAAVTYSRLGDRALALGSAVSLGMRWLEGWRVTWRVREIFKDRFAAAGIDHTAVKYLAQNPIAVGEILQDGTDEAKAKLSELWKYVLSDVADKTSAELCFEGLAEYTSMLEKELGIPPQDRTLASLVWTNHDSEEVKKQKRAVFDLMLQGKVEIPREIFFGMLEMRDQSFAAEAVRAGGINNLNALPDETAAQIWSRVRDEDLAKALEGKGILVNVHGDDGETALLKRIKQFILSDQGRAETLRGIILLLRHGARAVDFEAVVEKALLRREWTVGELRNYLEENENLDVKYSSYGQKHVLSASAWVSAIQHTEDDKKIQCTLVEKKEIREWIQGTDLEEVLKSVQGEEEPLISPHIKKQVSWWRLAEPMVEVDTANGVFRKNFALILRVTLVVSPVILAAGVLAGVFKSVGPAIVLAAVAVPLVGFTLYNWYEEKRATKLLGEIAVSALKDGLFPAACAVKFVSTDLKLIEGLTSAEFYRVGTDGKSLWDLLVAGEMPNEMANKCLEKFFAAGIYTDGQEKRFLQLAKARRFEQIRHLLSLNYTLTISSWFEILCHLEGMELARILKEKKVDVEATIRKDGAEHTPLSYALSQEKPNKANILFLLAAGAKVDGLAELEVEGLWKLLFSSNWPADVADAYLLEIIKEGKVNVDGEKVLELAKARKFDALEVALENIRDFKLDAGQWVELLCSLEGERFIPYAQEHVEVTNDAGYTPLLHAVAQEVPNEANIDLLVKAGASKVAYVEGAKDVHYFVSKHSPEVQARLTALIWPANVEEGSL